jgi:NTP pyrophosphatase (non-canonical NTP hydrolase)
MIRKFLYWLTGKLPARTINGDQGEPYLERYFLFRFFGLQAYIHRFVASDPDRGLHDHPWDWSASLILVGGYREIRAGLLPRNLRPGRLNIIRGDDFHRIVLAPGREAWTLFIHGRRTKGWGFWREGQYLPHAAGKDDYPARTWWKEAARGRELRAQCLSHALNDIVRQCGTWADATFAPEGGNRGPAIVAHLTKEVIELSENPRDMEELADCMLLLFHLAHQNGGNLQAAIARKLEINKRRKWGKPDANGVVEHVRET